MCLAIPGRIIKINKPFADIELSGIIQTINIQLIEQPQIGDYVLVHCGFAIEKIDYERHTEVVSFLNTFIGEDKYET